ncbi:sensor histidine kinase [Streptococcus sp. S784/96/1]|uniref:sensor histidine kinase n=1 Tax=Streptococcus sp. S784/96/1 TaxID=2653499 RepID=UPI0013875A0D|nr:HAMP domain-containing sensor histidine kinase [Streptococcus sp. S784/96/1]
MIRHYSIKKRVFRTVWEIVLGTLAILLIFFAVSYALVVSGQLNTYDLTVKIPIESLSKSDTISLMETSTFDYLLIDREKNKEIAGNYQKSDWAYYEQVIKQNNSVQIGSVRYTEYKNSEALLIVRQPILPEFVNPKLRQIPYNTFSYFLISGLELILLIWSVAKLLREFTRNFRLIEVISLNMGSKDVSIDRRETEMIEFNTILNMLYQKDDELVALLEAERQDRKDLSFQVAALAHDVKTPLTVLKGNLELLEMTDLDEKQVDFVSSMTNSVITFEKYFNSMVNYSRLLIEDKDYQEKIELTKFLSELTGEAKEMMAAEQVTLVVDNLTERQFLRGNKLNLNRALINILANAVRYSSGERMVTLSVKDDNDFLVFEVWNNGQPFTEEALTHASGLFYTDNKGRDKNHYGIGLSFAHKVAQRYQGQLVLSNPSKGGALVTLLIKNDI